MNIKKNNQSKKISNRIRSSLVIKLNARMLGRLFSGFLAINIIIIIMSFSVMLWKTEEGANYIIETMKQSPNSFHSVNYNNTNYQIAIIEEPTKGIILPDNLKKILPVNVDAERSITISQASKNIGLFEKVDLVKYTIEFTLKDISYQMVYDLGNDIRLFLYLFFVVLLFELLILVGNIRKGSKIIRKTLKPLADLTEKAKSLNAEVSAMRAKFDDGYIKDLAGAISSIDAKKLDKRISVNSSQSELKDLASAINDMLNRINSSYQAQVRFVSDASHELRTPISVIQGYVNLLDRWGKEDQTVMQESIDAIKAESENMKELIEQLLFLARGDNETIQIYEEVFDTCEIVDEIVNETQMIDSNHNFEIDLDRPAYINADKQLLKQVIRILVDNSIKYTPSEKKIIVRVVNKEGHVNIVVQDSGIGIVPEDLPHMFDRFYRSDESRARETGGSGLGLSIAKWIIERHGAHFEILSRVSIGTRITIVFSTAELKSNVRNS